MPSSRWRSLGDVKRANRRYELVWTAGDHYPEAMLSAPAVPPELHELETIVMDAMWQLEHATVRDVREHINRRAKPERAYTTFMTVMRRLADKGLLLRERNGKSDTYAPSMTRVEYEQARASAHTAELVSRYGDVALASFARELAELDSEHRRKLTRLARRG